MKLWKLEALRELGWDCCEGFVVRAGSEREARELANTRHADEGPIWLDPEQASCVELTADGESEIVLRDFLRG